MFKRAGIGWLGLPAAIAAIPFVSSLDAVYAGDAGQPGGPVAAVQAKPDNPLALHLRAGTVDTSQARPGFADLAADPDEIGNRYVIQLDGPMTPARRDALNAAGVMVGDYLPTNAFIVRIDGADPRAAAGLGFVRWYSEYLPQWKLDPEIGQREFFNADRIELENAGRRALYVTLFFDERGADVVQTLEQMDGAEIHWMENIGGNPVISVTVNAEQVDQFAHFDAVQFVEPAPDIMLRNNRVRWVVQSNIDGVTPMYDNDIRGEGQIIGVLDSRVDRNHCSFVDSEPIGPNHRKILADNTGSGSPGSHGTHVAGTAVGDAGADANTRGVAYMSKMVFGLIPSFNESSVVNALTQHHNQGARVHTNSWGNDGTTAYDGLARGFDVFLRNQEDSFACLAVTNQSNLRNPENAKNLLAVGATQPAPNQHNHCTGGTGPTSDGRRKPEIYAPGCSTVSSTPGSCSTGSSSGTSMATPAIAGTALLTRQYFTEGYYPGGVPGSGEPITPTGALLKAVLLNSAVDMTGVPGYPSNLEGWGRALLDNSLFFPGDSRRIFIVDIRNNEGLSTNDVHQHTVTVNSSDEPLRLTMVFTDVPGASGASQAWVNDLDLVVFSPSGDQYYGNVFSGGQSVPGGSPDHRNNVEQVHILSPQPGDWTVQIVGTAVNQQQQGYAFVATGDIESAPAGVTVSLASGIPGLVPSGQSVTVEARIRENDDQLVPGSETIFFRYDGGDFEAMPLINVGGEFYEATLPAVDCGDEPEFYLAAEGVDSGVVTSPFNAPNTLHSFSVGEIEVTTILDADFESGLPSGWSSTGIWHVSGSCSVGTPCGGESQWAYYGQSGTCNYNTGARNSGNLNMPTVSLPDVPPGGEITLEFCYNLETESSSSYDIPTVFVNNTAVDEPPDSSSWTTRTVNLAAYAGQDVNIRFHFDTIDGILNNFRGWQISSVKITAASVVCEPACPPDWNGDGVVDSDDLFDFLSDWAAGNADYNGDGVTDSDDLFDFLADWSDGC